MSEDSIVKSETEIQKVVKALSYMYMKATFNAFADCTTKEFIKGLSVTVTLKPGQETDAEKLMSCNVECTDTEYKFIPPEGYITEAMRLFVLAVRKEFTSIHQFKKVLSYKLDKYPDEHDLEWADAVAASYGVTKPKEYVAEIQLVGDSGNALIMLGHGETATEHLKVLVRSGFFIEKVEGFTELASKEEDRPNLKPGLKFREM